MRTPSLCGDFLTNKRSLIAFTWTITTVLTLVAFILSLVMTIHTHTHYKRMERYYSEQREYHNQYQNDNGEEGGGGNSQDSQDREYEALIRLGQVSSSSVTFASVYTLALAVALSLYGSTAIVGFTSLNGVYIGPCFSNPDSSTLKVGIFGGAIIVFANLLLVCAVVFGEVRVVADWDDHRNDQNNDDREPYEVERIATILAVTCMFLSALYTIFAILLFLYYGSERSQQETMLQDESGAVVAKHDPRRESFITMGESS